MATCKIFYSWQSDLPNNTNRSLILQALENVAKQLRVDTSIELEPVIDRDTLNVPGSPNIATTILNKISEAHIFVCDVSIINSTTPKPCPNPNVLFELGYAIAKLGSERIITVLNKAFGGPEQLPFDLRMHRVLTYNLSSEDSNKAPVRKELERNLDNAIRIILPQIKKQQPYHLIIPKPLDQPIGLPLNIMSKEITTRRFLSSYTREESGRGYYSIHGEIFNNLDKVIFMPDVAITFFDSQDNIIPVTIGSGQRFCSSMVLYPDSKAPFHY